jgi:hypothetical protein
VIVYESVAGWLGLTHPPFSPYFMVPQYAWGYNRPVCNLGYTSGRALLKNHPSSGGLGLARATPNAMFWAILEDWLSWGVTTCRAACCARTHSIDI